MFASMESLNSTFVGRVLPLGTPLPAEKVCGRCHRSYDQVVTKAVVCKAGHLWMQCVCDSTMTMMNYERPYAVKEFRVIS